MAVVVASAVTEAAVALADAVDLAATEDAVASVAAVVSVVTEDVAASVAVAEVALVATRLKKVQFRRTKELRFSSERDECTREKA